MALNDMGGYTMTMPVTPMYGGGYPVGNYGGMNAFGGDGNGTAGSAEADGGS